MTSTYFRPIDILYAYVLAIGYNFVYLAWLFVTRNLPVPEPSFTVRPTTKNEVAIVTGSSSGIGFETARELVLQYGMTVIIACRSRSRSMAAADLINAEVSQQGDTQGGRAVVVHALDLSSFTSVRGFAAAVKRKFSKIHVLVNNAGMLGGKIVASEGGLDLTFQSNFLGHFLLTAQLMDVFAPQARVLNQTALGHHFCGGYDVENPNFWRSCAIAGERPDKTYLFSKLAQLLFTTELNRRYSDRIRSFAVNPGVVNSDMWAKDYGPSIIRRYLFLTAQEGCRPAIVACVGELHRDIFYLQPYKMPWKGASLPLFQALGPYQGHNTLAKPRLPADGGARASAALWDVSEQLTGSIWPHNNSL